MKKLSVLLILLLLLSLFTACKQTPAPSVTTTAPTAEPVPASTDTAPVATTAPVTTGTEDGAFTPEELAAVHPMLFHVTGPDGQEGYLFGTIHVGDARVETALQKLQPYLDACDALAVEFDLVAFEQDFAAQMQSMTAFLYTDGSDITSHMPKELYDRAEKLLGEAGLFPSLMKAYNLGMWSQLVEQAAIMTRTDYDAEIGMDRSLIHYCYDKQIEVRDVESAQFQYDLLASFSDELYLLMIENTLDSLDDYGSSVDELYAAWLGGSYEQIVSVLQGEDEEETEALTESQQKLLEDYNDKLLTQRNLGMRDKALEWLRAGDKVFFAVGAAHLVEEDGLIALLRAEGYTVEQVAY